MEIPKKASITGVQVAYYLICRRKLWLFSHQIGMEHTSQHVDQGKLLHETAYKRKFKELAFEGIKIDFFERRGELHEIKKSRKIEEAHEYQILYYLWVLKQKGINLRGVTDYPLLKQRVEVLLTEEKEQELAAILGDIDSINKADVPLEPKRLPYCRSCSYYNFCWC